MDTTKNQQPKDTALQFDQMAKCFQGLEKIWEGAMQIRRAAISCPESSVNGSHVHILAMDILDCLSELHFSKPGETDSPEPKTHSVKAYCHFDLAESTEPLEQHMAENQTVALLHLIQACREVYRDEPHCSDPVTPLSLIAKKVLEQITAADFCPFLQVKPKPANP